LLALGASRWTAYHGLQEAAAADSVECRNKQAGQYSTGFPSPFGAGLGAQGAEESGQLEIARPSRNIRVLDGRTKASASATDIVSPSSGRLLRLGSRPGSMEDAHLVESFRNATLFRKKARESDFFFNGRLHTCDN